MQGEIRTFFEIEARELIDKLSSGVAQLNDSAPDPATVQSMLRAAHTLKGAAHVVGEPGLADLAHQFEDELARHQANPTAESANVLLQLSDRLATELARSNEPAPETAANPELSYLPEKTIRVDLTQTQQVLDHVNQASVVAASLRATLQQLKSANASPDLLQTLEDQLDRLDRETRDLFRLTSQLRLVSTDALLLEAGRMLRATAAALNKQAQCVTRGTSERVDLHILEGLEEALLHLIRNAVSHAIEPPAERLRQGKASIATITVTVERNGNHVVLTVADDGRGIDPEPIRAAALRRGDLTAFEAAHASREELLALLLRPGFSTTRSADQISGRGIGLDAVHETAVRLGGTLHIDTEPGRGATFTLTIPQTLFAVSALEVSADRRRYVLPLAAVEHTFLLGPHHKISRQGKPTLLLGQETIPVVTLNDLLPASSQGHSSPPGNPSGLVISSQGRRLALLVDRIEGTIEALVRPIPTLAGVSSLIAGAALGPNGEPQLVLDPAGLFAASSNSASSRNAFTYESTPIPLAPILVIDDSLTTRMLEQSILEAEGYQVELAHSAEQGLALARSKTYALFLVDVEMPGMNGFEFVQTVTQDPQLSRTPAILVTSLDSADHRERGRKAGARSYIVKGEFNQKIYLDRIRETVGGQA